MLLTGWLLGAVPFDGPGAAQEVARPQLEGRVSRSAGRAAPSEVVLHRVTPDGSGGEIDTVRADSDGHFQFDLPGVPDPGGRGEVYFASVEHQGVLYFGPAIHTAVQLDSLYPIEIYDTLAAPAGGADLTVEMRYLIVEPGAGQWSVTDLVQVRNDGLRTLVASDGGFVASLPLPSGAADFEAGATDTAPDEVLFSGGSALVVSPLPPGPRQFVVRYTVDPPLDLALPGLTHALEVLVLEPAPSLEVDGLVAMGRVEMEPGVSYRRFAGTQLLDAVVRLRPGEEPKDIPIEWLSVLLGLLLAGAGVWAVRRSPRSQAEDLVGAAVVTPRTVRERRQRLLLYIARLDERLEAESTTPRERRELAGRREALLRRTCELS